MICKKLIDIIPHGVWIKSRGTRVIGVVTLPKIIDLSKVNKPYSNLTAKSRIR